MDILSHGLWGGAAFGRKKWKLFVWAFAFGVLPDVVALGSTFISHIFAGGHGPLSEYAITLYSITHSLVIALFGLLFALWIFGRRCWVVAAWPLHVLFDIPTHELGFFPTPFLWPFATPFVDGIRWSTPWLFALNWGLLILAYLFWAWHKKSSK